MYELFKSNEQDESLLLLKEKIPSERKAMKLLKECEEPHCQIEKFDIPNEVKGGIKAMKKRNFWDYVRYMGVYGRYTLIATKHNKIITKYY